MLIFNYLMGVAGLILAGDSIGRGVRSKNIQIMLLGVSEIIAGLYFFTAAIGST